MGTTVRIHGYDELYETWERRRSGGGETHEATMERIYGEGRKPVTFHHTTWEVRVRNQGAQSAGAGRIVHYYDQPVGPDGDQSNCAVQETVAVPDATVGLLTEPVPPQSLAVVLMQYAQRDWHWLSCPAVQRSPGVLSGAWVFRGTRMPVSNVLDHLSWGRCHWRLCGEFSGGFGSAGGGGTPARGPGPGQIRRPDTNLAVSSDRSHPQKVTGYRRLRRSNGCQRPTGEGPWPGRTTTIVYREHFA